MSAAPRLPALAHIYEIKAPAGWRAVEFISDLHLSEISPRTFDVFARYLRETRADALYVLGDLFEVWVGDDARITGSFARRVCDVLSESAAVRATSFMAGNRDFLVGAAMLRDCGLAAMPDPTLLDAWGHRVLLSHGDELCLDDTDYQRFRAQVRTAAWQRDFLAKPLPERERIARSMRDASDAAKHAKAPAAWADVDAAAAVSWMHAAHSRTLIHGHTHRPASEELAPGYLRHVLSDWDCDRTPCRAQAMRLTRDGLTRIDLLDR